MGIPCHHTHAAPSQQDIFILSLVKNVIKRDGYSNEIYTKMWNMAGISEQQVIWALQIIFL